jgi:glycosyltransferase involved in cell wall biosynthesis
MCWRIWLKGRFDTLQFCNPPDIFFPIAMLYRTLGAGVIFDHHDLFPELVSEQFPGLVGKVLYTLARMAEFLTFRVSHVVISTNESYRQIAIGRGKIPGDRTVVVRNAPKINQFVPVDADPTIRRGFRFLACYAGGMGFQDGLLELVSAIRYVVQEADRHDILFILLGDGAAYSQTAASLKAWELDKVVDMPGMIRDRALLRRYLSTADVLLSPEPMTPLNTRSTFVKVGEYMAMGKPVVAFDLAETRITAAEAAVYVEPGDLPGFGRAILTLLDDPERRKRMGEIGRQRVLSKFGWEHQEPNLLRAYEIAWVTSRQQQA